MSVELLLAIVGAVAAILAGFRWIASIAMRQFEARLEERFGAFAAQMQESRAAFATQIQELRSVGEARLLRVEGKYEELDKDVRRILIELPRDYVARADYVRRETVMEAKIDQLGLRIENWMLKGEKK